MNVISTEQIERFPDGQVADAVRRLPGVATFDDRGEAENVFLRGMAPGMNVVTLDGERMPTTGLRNREVSLSAMPAEDARVDRGGEREPPEPLPLRGDG